MSYKIPKKVVIDGRLQFGKQFIKQAKSQLGILKDQMSYRNLTIGRRWVKFNDDVHFICDISHKQETVIIITDPWLQRVLETPYRVCPKTKDLALAFIDKLHGMSFNQEGEVVAYPGAMYWDQDISWDIWVCEGFGTSYRYSYWEECKPFCYYVHDHVDDIDLGWQYDARAALTGLGRAVLARPVRDEEGTITTYRVTNIIPEGFQQWETFLEYETYRVARY